MSTPQDGNLAADERSLAIKRLKAKREFRSHVGTYVLVNLLLIGIWAATGAGYFWPIWAILGWGIGIGFHAWSTFGEKPLTEEEIQREIERGRASQR